MASPTPRGLHRLDTIDPYRLVADWNMAEEATDAALTAVEDGLVAYADQVGRDTRDSIVLPSVNLYNRSAAGQSPGNALQGNAGDLVATASYDVTHYIPVTGGETYTIGGPGIVRSIAQYKADKTYLGPTAGWVDNADYSVETVTMGADTAYLRVTVTAGNLGSLMVVEGTALPTSYVPYGATGLAPDLDVLVQDRIDTGTVEKVSAVEERIWRDSDQIYNPAEAKANTALQLSTGAEVALTGYTTTGHMPVTAGKTYTLSTPRHIVWYDAAKSMVSAANHDNTRLTATAPAGAAYLRAGVLTSNEPTFMVNAGSTLLPWEPYARGALTASMAAAVRDAVDSDGAGGVTVTRDGQAATITRTLDGHTLTERVTLRDTQKNRSFQFGTVTWDGVTLTGATDDITPIRTQMGTVAGGHGFAGPPASYPANGQTGADCGSVWSSGGKELVIVDVTGGRVVMIAAPVTGPDGTTTARSASVATGEAITHVSGATNTATITATDKQYPQLYPSVTRQDVRLTVDGVEVTEDGTYTGQQVTVHETYDLMDYADLWAQARAHIGQPIGTYPVAGAVTFHTAYTWTPRGACEITTDLTELLPTTLNTAGGVQAQAHNLAGDRRWRSIPGVGTVGGVDWTAGVDTAQWSQSVIVTSGDLTGAHPPLVDLERVQTAGQTVVGFAIGYKPDTRVADSDSTARLQYAASNLWDVRSTGKHYPTAWAGREAGWGHLRVCGWRAYLAPADADRVAAARTSTGAWAAVATATGMGDTA